jgi:AraC-like DNA-binding protein
MLQDRRRPLWPAWVLMLPPVMGVLAYMATCSSDYLSLAYIYFLLMSIGLFVYMVRAVRQYGRWLRDNYADLEHKEVWQTFVVLAVIVLVIGYYVSGDGSMAYEYIVQVLCIVLICHLLWRVETLSDLGIPVASDAVVCVEDAAAETAATEDAVGDGEISSSEALSDATFEQIGSMLKQRCEDTRLYLHHGLTLAQLTQAVGTNRFYLSQYFSSLDMNYNAYINNLRINHFVSLYHEAVDSKRSFTVQQLALESGFHSYTTFSDAFKRKMGLSVRSWIKAARPEGKVQHEGLGES